MIYFISFILTNSQERRMKLSARKLVFNFSEWLHEYHCSIAGKQSIEVYAFINPLCPHSWEMDPILKRLQLEYGKHICIKHILSGNIASLSAFQKLQSYQPLSRAANETGVACWEENVSYRYESIPYNASLAIKAAELQGKKRGIRFLRKLQQYHFIKNKDLSKMKVLVECAEAVNLDVEEFLADISSHTAEKAIQCDIKVAVEMDVQEVPSLVFFNEKTEDEGIKVSGIYSYDIYQAILKEIMPSLPDPAPLPTIESFVRFYQVTTSQEIAVVYNMNIRAIECEMRNLTKKGTVQKVLTDHGVFWKYKQTDKKAGRDL